MLNSQSGTISTKAIRVQRPSDCLKSSGDIHVPDDFEYGMMTAVQWAPLQAIRSCIGFRNTPCQTFHGNLSGKSVTIRGHSTGNAFGDLWTTIDGQ